jgi:hypothetical protein
MATMKHPKPQTHFNQIAEAYNYNDKDLRQIKRSLNTLRQDHNITGIPEWAVATAGKPVDVSSIEAS